jgi:hypothetical protein
MTETREISPTGGAKGSKGTAFRNIPMDFLLELGKHYGDGEAKYPSDPDGLPNFWKGYDIGLNIEAMLRHLFAWIGGEDDIPDDGTDDPTIGNNHLLAVVWHAIDCWRKQRSEWDTRPAVAQSIRERGRPLEGDELLQALADMVEHVELQGDLISGPDDHDQHVQLHTELLQRVHPASANPERFSVWEATPHTATVVAEDAGSFQRALAQEMDAAVRDYDRAMASELGYDFYAEPDGTVHPISPRARGLAAQVATDEDDVLAHWVFGGPLG